MFKDFRRKSSKIFLENLLISGYSSKKANWGDLPMIDQGSNIELLLPIFPDFYFWPHGHPDWAGRY